MFLVPVAAAVITFSGSTPAISPQLAQLFYKNRDKSTSMNSLIIEIKATEIDEGAYMNVCYLSLNEILSK